MAVISKPPSRPVTPTSAVVDVSSDNDGADGGEELEPRTKRRKEDKIEEKQKAPRSLSTQAAFVESISKQQEAKRRKFEHEIKMQMVTQERE